jgi:hypothetical protein
MKDEKFTEYTERCLDLGRKGGWEKEIKAKEGVAWELHEMAPPTGSLLLSHLILQQGTSYLRRDIGTKEFAKQLASQSFQAVQNLEEKDGWDHYYLGLSYQYGRGTSQDYSLAADSFLAASQVGNRYAQFEALWARHLAGGSRLDAVLGLSDLRGKLADFAAYSARALALLELGQVREPGSSSHIARILLLKRALNDFIFHDHGARQIRIAIEKELREGVNELQHLQTPRAFLALYLTAKASRSNPTGKEAIEWFRKAINPEIEELETLCRRQDLSIEELRLIVEHAESEGWTDALLAKLAADGLHWDDDEF